MGKRGKKASPTGSGGDWSSVLAQLGENEKSLQDIKRLMILLLAKLGSDSGELARALGVGPSTVRTMFPMRKIKRIGGLSSDGD